MLTSLRERALKLRAHGPYHPGRVLRRKTNAVRDHVDVDLDRDPSADQHLEEFHRSFDVVLVLRVRRSFGDLECLHRLHSANQRPPPTVKLTVKNIFYAIFSCCFNSKEGF